MMSMLQGLIELPYRTIRLVPVFWRVYKHELKAELKRRKG